MKYGVTFQFEAETREEAIVELGPDAKWTDVYGIEEGTNVDTE